MGSKGRYAVTYPPLIFWLDLFIIGFFVVAIVLNTLFTPPPHTAMYGWITAIVFIPAIWVALMTKLFRISVNGTRISVRRRLGLFRFSFDISSIVRVDVKAVDSGVGRLLSMTLHTSDNKKVNVDALMVNADKLMKLVMNSVEEDRIHYTYRAMSKR